MLEQASISRGFRIPMGIYRRLLKQKQQETLNAFVVRLLIEGLDRDKLLGGQRRYPIIAKAPDQKRH